ncbi:MAG: aldehyde dehydrogenase family protein, partial [Chloroflexota bacterium]
MPWEYAPAPESRDIVTIQERYGLFIGGRFVPATDGATFSTVNPATEETLALVAKGSPADADRAVRAARRAQTRSWGRLPGKERAKYLFRIARILQERSREFAVLESMDSGKPIKESRDVDVPLAAAHFWYYAGWADKLEYAFPGRTARPLGVAAQIIPWNFPLLMLSWKIAPALAAGNTVVLKPASTTPLSALLFADVCRQADLPPGVVNIVTGPGETGMALVTHKDVDKVAFTGSTEIGKRIAKGVAGTDKALTLELGGKAANIVFDDAPLDQAVGVARRAFKREWSTLPGSERAKYLFRIARILQERSREFAVLESLDGGKPIKESRDVDVPLAAAHFWYYAGWADKLEYTFPNRDPQPLGVAAQIIPWNFPLLMLA